MRAWKGVALLTLLAAAGAAVESSADEAPAKAGGEKKASLFERFKTSLTPGKKDEPEAKTPVAEKPAAEDKSAPLMESVAALRDRELKILFRRQAVCEKIREIAMQAGDQALLRQAEQLDQRAWNVYLQRTNQAASGPAPARPSGAAEGLDPAAVRLDN